MGGSSPPGSAFSVAPRISVSREAASPAPCPVSWRASAVNSDAGAFGAARCSLPACDGCCSLGLRACASARAPSVTESAPSPSAAMAATGACSLPAAPASVFSSVMMGPLFTCCSWLQCRACDCAGQAYLREDVRRLILNNEQHVHRKRPIWVWLISLFFLVSAIWTLLSLYLIWSGAIPLEPAQQAYFDRLTLIDHVLTIVVGVLNLSGAIALFLLRKIARDLFLSSLGMRLFLALWVSSTQGWIEVLGRGGLAL